MLLDVIVPVFCLRSKKKWKPQLQKLHWICGEWLTGCSLWKASKTNMCSEAQRMKQFSLLFGSSLSVCSKGRFTSATQPRDAKLQRPRIPKCSGPCTTSFCIGPQRGHFRVSQNPPSISKKSQASGSTLSASRVEVSWAAVSLRGVSYAGGSIPRIDTQVTPK